VTLRTYYPTPEPTFAPAPGPDRSEGLLWGYTVGDLDRVARAAVIADRSRGMDQRTAYDIAWEGIATHLVDAEAAPSYRDLVTAGWRAIYTEIRQGHRMRGIPDSEPGYSVESLPRFAQYWGLRTVPSPETRIVERVALEQILPALTEVQQRGLAALAVRGDYQAAADLLGINYRALVARVNAGRKRFLAVWFEHETPPKRRRTDRRVGSRGSQSDACPAGHEWTEENTRWTIRTVNGTVRRSRRCRACQRDRDAARRAARPTDTRTTAQEATDAE
jgi:hypothetical protein